MPPPRRSTPAIQGLPPRKRQGPGGVVASLFLHATIAALLITSPMTHGFTARSPEGAGGEGPSGGGGGERGSGFDGERLRYVRMRPPPPPPPALVPGPPLVSPVVPRPQAAVPVALPPVTGAPAGAATGAAAGAGAGPGTGGGVGSGIGAGRGTGVGSGAGGGEAVSYPPTPTQFFLPPLPAPQRIKPYNLVAWFDVDERGNARLIGFNPSRDAGYNRRLREVLQSLRFRPGVRADGTPVRDTVDVQYSFH